MVGQRLAAGLALVLVGCGAIAEERDEAVLAATIDERRLLVMPLPEDTAPRAMTVDDVRIEIAVEKGFRVYRARHKGRTHTAHAPIEGPPRRFVFDPERERFAEVTSTLLVRMTDYDRLDEIVIAAGAIAGKSYPALGWALLQLPPEANPAAVARTLTEHELVTGADIQLRSPIRVPL